MSEPIDEAYFNWLYAKVAWHDVHTPSTTYQSLLFVLHSTEFVWTVVGDDNRAEEGKELRTQFLREAYEPRIHDAWIFLDCSVLEMMIAFAARLSFQTEGLDTRGWFWKFMENLGLSELTDGQWAREGYRVPLALDKFVWRLYPPTGQGGLFPLMNTDNDQRKVELWYQFCEYVIENDIS